MQFAHEFTTPNDAPRPSVFGDHFLPPPVGSNMTSEDMSQLHSSPTLWGPPPLDSSSMPGLPDGRAMWLQTTPAQMPWGVTQPSLVRFTGEQCAFGNNLHFKRKKELEPGVSPASKRLMTEEYMTAHMSNLRISNGNEHLPQQFHNNVEFESNPTDVSSDSENDQALKQLFVCDEIKRFESEILPNAILCKLQKPSTALMLWQPPAGILGEPLRESILSRLSRRAAEQEQEQEEDNNNASALDLNTLSSGSYMAAGEHMDM